MQEVFCGTLFVVAVIVFVAVRAWPNVRSAVASKVWEVKYARTSKLVNGLFSQVAHAIVVSRGFTIDRRGNSPTKGYAVSLLGNECIYRPWANEGFWDVEQVRTCWYSYAENRAALILTNPKLHFGGWVSDEREKLYLDVSIVVPTLAEAIALGRLNKQLAVYCIHTGDVIPVE